MCAIMEQVRLDGEREATLKHIKKIMFKRTVSAEEAMDELDVPEEEQSIYLELIKKSI